MCDGHTSRYRDTAHNEPMTPTTRYALADAAAGRSGVLCDVERPTEPEIPDAIAA